MDLLDSFKTDEFEPSHFQQAIFDHIENDTSSLVVEALAGSGKTSTIIQAASLIPKSSNTLFCAFNKTIATELERKLPENITCCTLNALGHRAWMRYTDSRIKLDSNKTYQILSSKEFLKGLNAKDVKSVAYTIVKMVALAKHNGLVPKKLTNKYNSLIDDNDSIWHRILDHHMISVNVNEFDESEYMQDLDLKKQFCIELARKALEFGIEDKKTIDFNDQLYMPVIHDVSPMSYDVIFVDEAQDISGIQRSLLRLNLKEDGRLIAVGDKNQAIYGFRGADSNSLSTIKTLFNADSLPLSISYRCSREVIKSVQKLVPNIQEFEHAKQGKIEHLGAYNSDVVKLLQDRDFILCRNVAPLIKFAFFLISKSRPVYIEGRDIGKSIIQIIKKLKCDDYKSLVSALGKWEESEIIRIKKNDPDNNCAFIINQADAVRTFIENSNATSVKELTDDVTRLFTENKNSIILSTIHKSKGLEAERVIILDRKLMPSPFATKQWQKQQEDNLLYVAMTRSSDYLGYIQTPE